jgi:hypothetical protein
MSVATLTSPALVIAEGNSACKAGSSVMVAPAIVVLEGDGLAAEVALLVGDDDGVALLPPQAATITATASTTLRATACLARRHWLAEEGHGQPGRSLHRGRGRNGCPARAESDMGGRCRARLPRLVKLLGQRGDAALVLLGLAHRDA